MKKKENIVIIVLLVIMALAVIGVSYAAFNYQKQGVVNSITTGAIKMTYTESDNVINIDKALPTKDSAGTTRLKDGEYFDFTISSTISGNANINYEISAKDVTDSSERKIDGSNIKLYLTRLTADGEEELMSPETYNEEASENSYTGRPANEMSLYESSMNSSETNNYRLRMYVTEEYNPQGDGGGLKFAVRINVYGKDGEKPLSAGETIINNLSNGSTYNDEIDTFITGEDPNNYVWYSGKLWRAVSVNNDAKTTKLVTQWNISTISYNVSNNSAFSGSHMEEWLNDESEDGFLGNLREPDKFIVTDAVWDASNNSSEPGSLIRPDGTTTVTDAVGLLNIYEYLRSSSDGIHTDETYLNSGRSWWTITPYSASEVHAIDFRNTPDVYTSSTIAGIRPAVNLKSNISIVDGDGTIDNPYRLSGDNDTDLSGTLLNTRYSGEYIRFGTGKNNLYRIVSHEVSELTKIVSATPLVENDNFKSIVFDENNNGIYSNKTTIGTFLNGDYLTDYVGSTDSNMIEDNTTWYLGTAGNGTSYKLAKYTDANGTATTSNITQTKVGLLRYGELMAGNFDTAKNLLSFGNNYALAYWLLTLSNISMPFVIGFDDSVFPIETLIYDLGITIVPSMNLKSNVIITGGTGTKEAPFRIRLG